MSKGKSQNLTRHRTRGGPNKIPRSFATVLKAIRQGLGGLGQPTSEQRVFSQPEMEDALPKVFSEFPMTDGERKPPVYKWESVYTQVPFGAQHRYARIAGVHTGILHLASLVFARWRDAEEKGRIRSDLRRREAELAAIDAVVSGLRELASSITELNKRERAWDGSARDDQYYEKAMLQLFDAFAHGAGKKRLTSWPPHADWPYLAEAPQGSPDRESGA